MNEGFARILDQDWHVAYVNRQGQVISSNSYATGEVFSQGRAAVNNPKSGAGYIDKTGQEIIPCTYRFTRSFSEGYGAVCKDGLWGFLNLDGDILVDFQHDNAWKFGEGLAPVGKRVGSENPDQYSEDDTGLYDVGYIDSSGQLVIKQTFSQAYPFREGLACINAQSHEELQNRDSSWGEFGFINKAGEIVIAPVFDEARSFYQGLAAVGKNDKWGYVNKEGELVVGFKYDLVGDFHCGFAYICNHKGEGYIDTEGREVIKPKLSEANTLNVNGMAPVALSGNPGSGAGAYAEPAKKMLIGYVRVVNFEKKAF
jgi:hypothetical protein